ncbi:GDSL-type esterase/lipase family protein [Streptococcus merionis]|uniref:GDSL-type esterase/lipase family protein n=1 Tax=Streptococcus merionis TaxID=400065 RepID=UPI0026ECFB67|nr:GDSL-type esterase/lipase family protein [Streptococcus merionis]
MLERRLFSQSEELAFRQLSLAEQQKVILAKYQERNLQAEPNGLVLAGDSLTEFLPHAKLALDGPLYNRGIRGIGIDFLQDHLKDLILDLAPRQLVLLIGTNDLMFGMAPEVLAEKITQLVDTISAALPQCHIYLQSLYPRQDSKQWGSALIDEIEVVNLYLRSLSGVTYIDVHSLLADKEQHLKTAYTRDGVHLTMAGYQVVLEALQHQLL